MFNVNNPEIGLSVSFSDKAVELLMKNRRGKGKSERGGHLFSVPEINEHIVISAISLPSNKDKSGIFFFNPNQNSSQATIDRQFKKNLAYAGDWHTHSTSSPTPSPKDIKTIKSIFRKSDHHLNYVLMVIVGTTENFSDSYFCLANDIEIYELI